MYIIDIQQQQQNPGEIQLSKIKYFLTSQIFFCESQFIGVQKYAAFPKRTVS